jgi:RimJ/RimL family protein N-acetyltransferase
MSTFIEGTNVILRGLEPADCHYARWLNNNGVCKNNEHHRMPYREEDAIEYINSSYSDTDKIVLAIVSAKSNAHIGNISLSKMCRFNRSAELGIIIGELPGKGYGTEACELMLEHGFNQLNLNRIYLGTQEQNIAMVKIADKLGMTREGVLRECIYKNGGYRNVIVFGMLASEYNEFHKHKDRIADNLCIID